MSSQTIVKDRQGAFTFYDVNVTKVKQTGDFALLWDDRNEYGDGSVTVKLFDEDDMVFNKYTFSVGGDNDPTEPAKILPLKRGWKVSAEGTNGTPSLDIKTIKMALIEE